MSLSPWQEKDRQHVWHPFTHLKYAGAPINIVRAEGAYYWDEQGKRYIDAISSWWVNLHGHSHPYLVQRVAEQLKLNAHSIFSGFTHPAAVQLAEKLLKHLPGFSKVFFSDDGSTAVEVALKMALQYWWNKGETRTKLIAFEDAYHGDTFGSMSVGARNVFTRAYTPLLFDVIRLPLPDEQNISQVLATLKGFLHTNEVAAFIFEPLVLGAGGMKMYEAKHLDQIIEICRAAGVICIADEVMTGFGRTGKFFAIDHLNNRPDIICLSKGITGGVMPLGVTACAAFVHDAYLSDDRHKTFFHGHSYTANPTACAAAVANMDLMELEETQMGIERISAAHRVFLEGLGAHTRIADARAQGTILALELKSQEESGYMNPISEQMSEWFIKKGILLRPLGNVLYILPPYCISNDDLNYIYQSAEDFLNNL